MDNLETNIPTQRQPALWSRILKAALKTQLGKHIAFTLGLKGFDRVGYRILRFSHYGEDDKAVYEKPSRFEFSYNARVDKGAAQQASLMSGSSLGSITSPLPGIYIALSTSSLTPAKTDTTLSGETAVAGLARAIGTVQNYVAPSALDGAASYDIFKQFTLTGSSTTIQSSALFDASSSGNMFAEANFSSSAVMNTNDILQVTWTVNI